MILWRSLSHALGKNIISLDGGLWIIRIPKLSEWAIHKVIFNTGMCLRWRKYSQWRKSKIQFCVVILAKPGSISRLLEKTPISEFMMNVQILWDLETKSISTILGAASWNHSGHSNRIFGLKFYDENTIISGGWDSVIHIWDIREGKSIHSFYGPHIAGDALDFKGFKILAGCYSAKEQIQLWDMRNLQQL